MWESTIEGRQITRLVSKYAQQGTARDVHTEEEDKEDHAASHFFKATHCVATGKTLFAYQWW